MEARASLLPSQGAAPKRRGGHISPSNAAPSAICSHVQARLKPDVSNVKLYFFARHLSCNGMSRKQMEMLDEECLCCA